MSNIESQVTVSSGNFDEWIKVITKVIINGDPLDSWDDAELDGIRTFLRTLQDLIRLEVGRAG